MARQKEMVEALREYGIVEEKLHALRRRETSPPQDFQKWESLYIQHLSPLAHLVATYPQKMGRMEATLPLPARERLGQADALCQSLSEKFSAFYQQALPSWEAGKEKRPTGVEDLPAVLKENGAILVLMDGMRWDMWEYVKESFFRSLADFRIAREGALWAHFPSSTPRQLELLQKALENSETKLWKVSGIDERVHTERGTLEHLFRNVLQYLQLDFAPRLRELPSDAHLILFSDHGFIENPSFEKTDKYRTSRYIHGGDSPFEIIVPWALVKRI
jgi:hypothetical protein